MKIKFYAVLIALLMTQCRSDNKGKLTMTNDELVKVMIELYTAKGILSLSPSKNKDSVTQACYSRISKNLGKPMSEIESNINALIAQPDTLVALQGRALDSMRQWQTQKLNIVRDTTVVTK
jgi:hypothetical protein